MKGREIKGSVEKKLYCVITGRIGRECLPYVCVYVVMEYGNADLIGRELFSCYITSLC